MRLSLGISTCPNDTFIFGAIILNKINHKYDLDVVLDDVEVLNRLALENKLDVVKVSYGVVEKVKENYKILKAGGALGFGCGPIIVSRNFSEVSELNGLKIAIPGANTTAFKIYKHFFSYLQNEFVEMRFDKIMPAIRDGIVDAGVVIHEGRFIYERFGLKKVIDLGDIWEKRYNAPIPLGCILIRNELIKYASFITETIRESIDYSQNHYEDIFPFIKSYAQELDDEVINKHIKLFVNEYSYDVSSYIDVLSKFVNADKNIFV
jgi:1,4-dihydroxy-6-naphthoate synthase